MTFPAMGVSSQKLITVRALVTNPAGQQDVLPMGFFESLFTVMTGIAFKGIVRWGETKSRIFFMSSGRKFFRGFRPGLPPHPMAVHTFFRPPYPVRAFMARHAGHRFRFRSRVKIASPTKRSSPQNKNNEEQDRSPPTPKERSRSHTEKYSPSTEIFNAFLSQNHLPIHQEPWQKKKGTDLHNYLSSFQQFNLLKFPFGSTRSKKGPTRINPKINQVGKKSSMCQLELSKNTRRYFFRIKASLK
jgi:hypothetical protein